MQCSSVGCNLAQWKNIRPWRPDFGPEGQHFVSGNSRFFYFWEAAKMWWCAGGRAAPRLAWQWGPKRRARTRGQNPLVFDIYTRTVRQALVLLLYLWRYHNNRFPDFLTFAHTDFNMHKLAPYYNWLYIQINYNIRISQTPYNADMIW